MRVSLESTRKFIEKRIVYLYDHPKGHEDKLARTLTRKMEMNMVKNQDINTILEYEHYDIKKLSEEIKKNMEMSLLGIEVFQKKSEEHEKQLRLRTEELENRLHIQAVQFKAERDRLINSNGMALDRKTETYKIIEKKMESVQNDLKKKEEKMKEMEELIHSLTVKQCKLDEELKDAREVILSMAQNNHMKEDKRKMKWKMFDEIEMDKGKLQLEAKEEELKKRERKLKLQEARMEAERIELRTQKRMRLGEGTTQDIFGVKVIGELDRKPFLEAMKRKLPGEEAEKEATMLWSSLRKFIKDPTWHPFKIIVDVEGNFKEIIPDVENEGTLKFLKNEYGEEVCNAVTEALLEMNEYPRGRYMVSELWNHREKRRATRKEVVLHLLNLRKGHQDGKTVIQNLKNGSERKSEREKANQ